MTAPLTRWTQLQGLLRQQLLQRSGVGGGAAPRAAAALPPLPAVQLRLLSGAAAGLSSSSGSTTTRSSGGGGGASTSGPDRAQQAQQQPQQQQQQQQQPETLAEIRARVFGTALGDGRRSGRKALAQPLRGKEFSDWYFEIVRGQQAPFMEDDIETDRLAKVARYKATGRAPPKKGQGKRSGKK
ncbi:hypothetical protein Rsub_12008 [Raphidocelis subcapitata]|uniref:Small ribosomal subunit protein mS33 n=1 Tax=Raphidocelis subcapitata TaxID=307507 RepID=A0A2V0PH77_9CHLO|nr:hypothetical protein Rsub_12008 [Raphidocelis subcapitata]|eukprot:GBF99116.1 hypothetical protein Rsub_12008 [Raphidocelis subcapitata]